MTGTQENSLLRRVFQNRLTLYIILLIIEAMFFVTNYTNSVIRPANEGWELKIDFIDNHLTPMGLWLIPYFMGVVFSILLPLWAAIYMPNEIFRQFILATAFAALISYVIYMSIPTYVVKPTPDQVPGDGLFSQWLRQVYEADNEFSTHNAAPSQHVFYAILNMCFMIRFRPRPRVFWFWTTMATLITVSALLTRQHHTPDLIAGYIMALLAYPAGLWLGSRVTELLGDADEPHVTPIEQIRRMLRARRKRVSARVDSV